MNAPLPIKVILFIIGFFFFGILWGVIKFGLDSFIKEIAGYPNALPWVFSLATTVIAAVPILILAWMTIEFIGKDEIMIGG